MSSFDAVNSSFLADGARSCSRALVINLGESISSISYSSAPGDGPAIASSPIHASYCRAWSSHSRRGCFLFARDNDDSRLSDPAMFLLWSDESPGSP
jgi:hypothetical protein